MDIRVSNMISELLIYKICVQRYVKSETRQNKSALFCVSNRDDGLLSVANGAAVATKKQKPQWGASAFCIAFGKDLLAVVLA